MNIRDENHMTQHSIPDPKAKPTVGLLRVPNEKHNGFLRTACQELGWPFFEIDLFSPYWLEQIQLNDAQIDLYAVWPMPQFAAMATLESRLGILERVVRKPICPPTRDLWFHENKERQYYWLRGHGIPVPDSVVIHRYRDYSAATALGFPLVAKTITGTCGQGVQLLHNEQEVEAYARQAFREGLPSEPLDPPAHQLLHALRAPLCRALRAVERETLYYDRQHGLAFFQKYIPNCREWRVTTIRNRAKKSINMWGYEKTAKEGCWKKSGSNLAEWLDPPQQAKDIALQIHRAHDFDSMCVDILECIDTGLLYANEFHACWGWLARGQLQINGVPGRWIYAENRPSPIFESGEWNMDAERLLCAWAAHQAMHATPPGDETIALETTNPRDQL